MPAARAFPDAADRAVMRLMVMLDLIILIAATNAAPTATIKLEDSCRQAVADKLGGDVLTFTIDNRRLRHGRGDISGQATVAIGMPAPPLGSASAHHLIRSDYLFRCNARDGSITSVRAKPRSF